VRLLLDHREDLVAERTRVQNRLRWHVHELAPDAAPPARSLDRLRVLATLEQRLADLPGMVARLARELLERVRALTTAINSLEREIGRLVRPLAPTLLALLGCGVLTAAKLVGETAGVQRFRSRAAFARHNGTAPVPVWSGNKERFRLNRGGNRQLNAALHRIAVTQLQRPGPGRAYVDRRMAAGNTKTEAIRALRRRLSDEVYRRLKADACLTPPLHPSC
jgi:transposase